MIYSLFIILILLFALYIGWQKGMVNQIASLLGLAFGFVAARLLYEPMSTLIDPIFPEPEQFAQEPFGTLLRRYTLYMTSAIVVFVVVYLLFKLFGSVITSALQYIHTGAINSILGSGFSFIKWTLLTSILLNVWIIFKPESELAAHCNDGDGNIVELIVSVAPALFGTEGPADLEHYHRLQQAKQMEGE